MTGKNINRDGAFSDYETQADVLSDRGLLIEVLRCTNCKRYAEKLADALFDRFGSYRRILLSRHEALLEVDGMTENAAELLCLIQNTYRKSMPKSADFINTYAGKMSDFIGRLMGHSLDEELWAAGFDELGILRTCHCLRRGDVSSLQTNIRLLLEYASRHRLHVISVAHNHPEGSRGGDNGADEEVLRLLHNVLQAFHIQLQEYIVLDDEMHIYTYNENPSSGELQQQYSDRALHNLADMIASEPESETVEDS